MHISCRDMANPGKAGLAQPLALREPFKNGPVIVWRSEYGMRGRRAKGRPERVSSHRQLVTDGVSWYGYTE